MDEASARAVLVDLSDTSASAALTATLPRHAVEQALTDDDGPMDLVLDVTRYADADGTEIAGTRKIALSWERSELEDLLHRSDGDSVTMVFDGEAVLRLIDPDVELHGMREAIAVLAVAVAAGGAAGIAAAQPAEDTRISGTAAIEQVQAGGGAVAPGADIEAVRSAAQNAPAAALAAASGIEAVRSAEPLVAAADTGALVSASGIEAVRSAEPLAAAADTGALVSASGIEAVRAAEPLAVSADTGALAASGIEAARSAEAAAARTPSASDGGITVSMPGSETTAALLGGFLLLITGATFIARSKRHELRLP